MKQKSLELEDYIEKTKVFIHPPPLTPVEQRHVLHDVWAPAYKNTSITKNEEAKPHISFSVPKARLPTNLPPEQDLGDYKIFSMPFMHCVLFMVFLK